MGCHSDMGPPFPLHAGVPNVIPKQSDPWLSDIRVESITTAGAPRHQETIYADLQARAAANGDPRLVVTFPVELPADTTAEQLEQWLQASGFNRVQAERVVDNKKVLDVVADRFRISNALECAPWRRLNWV